MGDVVFEFSGFRLDPRRRALSVSATAEAITLPPRAFDVLLLLVQHQGELLDKRTLMQAVWRNVVVDENSIDQNISLLRRALEAHAPAQTLITTERGRGYRFAAQVVTHSTGSDASFEAHQLYLQARTLRVRPSVNNLRGALELLNASLDLEPGFARALAERAIVRTVFAAFDVPMEDAFATAEREALQALELEPMLARAHQALANVLAARADWSGAHHHFDTASRLEEDVDARVTRVWQLTLCVGHLEKAVEQAGDIYRAAPSQPLGTIALAMAHCFIGHDREALSHADKAAALGWPKHQPPLPDIQYQIALREGRLSDAAQHMNDTAQSSREREAITLVCTALQNNAPGSALPALRALIADIAPGHSGVSLRRRVLLWMSLLGLLDEAFALANESVDVLMQTSGVNLLANLMWLPEMAPMRADPRFGALLARLRLPEYWKDHGPPDERFGTFAV